MNKLEKIIFFKKKKIKNSKGNIVHFINKKDKNFYKFGEIYFTWIKKKKKPKDGNIIKKCT